MGGRGGARGERGGGGGGGEGEIEVHRFCNRRSKITEYIIGLTHAIKNVIFGDAEISLVVIQLLVTRLQKTGFVYLLAVLWKKGGEWFYDILFTHGMVLVLWESLYYRKEWVWDLRTKVCCIASGMRNQFCKSILY